jgi:hypothetical protein
MKSWIVTAAMIGGLSLPILLAPSFASASCNDRKTTGTVVGGLGGALIGNSISRGGGGAILGGIGGAVLGHQIAKGTCNDYGRREYRARYRHHADYRGERSSNGYASDCRTEDHPYYDDRGVLVHRQTQVCGR